jgi:hypothetical protein
MEEFSKGNKKIWEGRTKGYLEENHHASGDASLMALRHMSNHMDLTLAEPGL